LLAQSSFDTNNTTPYWQKNPDRFDICIFSDVVVQLVMELVNVMLATQEMELTAQVSFSAWEGGEETPILPLPGL